jgi:hypothetical protein
VNNDVEMADFEPPQRQPNDRPLPNPVSNRVVIFDNIIGMSRKELEPELCRIAPWLQPDAVDIFRSGGLRVKCKTPADAERLLQRDGFPPNPFTPGFTVHRPGAQDNSRGISQQLDRDLRSVICSRIPVHLNATDLREIFAADYVESVRDIPPKNPNIPPLRVIVMKTRELREDALANGLKFYNRRVKVRPLRPPVLPLFCRKCSGYGHTAIDCNKPQPTCAKCSGNHLTITCLVQQRDGACPHCPDDAPHHFATYRGCPAFKAACAVESERRQARIDAKLASRNRRQPQREGPQQPRTNAPAPVQPGVSYLAAAQRNIPGLNLAPTANQQPNAAPIVAPQPPPPLQGPPIAPAPNDNAIINLLQTIRAEIAFIRQQQAAFDRKLIKLDNQQQRLEDRLDGVPDEYYGDDDRMEAEDNPHSDEPNDTTIING